MKFLSLLICCFLVKSAIAQISSTLGIQLDLNNVANKQESPSKIHFPETSKQFDLDIFIKSNKNKLKDTRQRAGLDELLNGNIAPFSKKLQPIYLKKTIDGVLQVLKIWVTSDYLALGTDDKHLRFPLSFEHTLELLKKFNALLPTTVIVDAVYAQSLQKVYAHPLPPIDGKMESFAYYQQIQKLIEKDLKGKLPFGLLAGHKKDLVLSKKLSSKPNSVAIYGWYYPSGRRIQNLNLDHNAKYVDYSHGIRLVAPIAELNGKEIEVKNILKDPILSQLISNEGAFDVVY